MRIIFTAGALILGLQLFNAGQASAAIVDKDPAEAAQPALDSRRSELNDLFAQLAAADNAAVAQTLANKIWQQWFNTDNQTVNAMLQGVMNYRRAHDLKQALILSDRIVAQFPAYSEGWNQRATLFYMLGDHQASLADIEQTLLREPRHFGALAGRASIYVLQGETEKARATLREALLLNPFISEKGILGDAE